MSTPTRAAEEILLQRDRARDLTAISPEISPRTLEDAYLVQEALHGKLAERAGGNIVGWKIALTTQTMQDFVGIRHPLAGAICEGTFARDPASVRTDDYVHLGVESEIALRIGRDVDATGTAFDADGIRPYVAGCAAAIEIVDDRNCDYPSLDPRLLVADNAFNAGCVIGEERTDLSLETLDRLSGAMLINGEEVGRGSGADVLGHPLKALAWLANHLNDRGGGLREGEWVLTGSVVATHWLSPGDEMATEVDGLGRARLKVG